MTASPLSLARPRGAIVGTATAAVERPAHTSLPRLAIASVEAALACAEMTLGDIDGVVSIPFSPSPNARQSDGYDVLSARYIASLLALGDVNFRLDLGPSEMMIDMVAHAQSESLLFCKSRLRSLEAFLMPWHKASRP